MNKDLLQKHIKHYKKDKAEDPEQFDLDWTERQEHVNKYQSYTEKKLMAMDEEELYEYISPLWAMMIWGNKGMLSSN